MESENRTTTALLVIDVQAGLFQKSTPIYQADDLLRKINTLIDRAHHAGVPVIYVQHSDQRDLIRDSEGWQLHPQLRPLEKDGFIFKEKSNSFEGTNLDETLRSKGIERLVITGLVTHGCVKNGCIGAKQLGYQVILVQDAHSNYSTKAAQLLEEWNEKLRNENVELKTASEITFG
jgi:nicotinamidase-related amidase